MEATERKTVQALVNLYARVTGLVSSPTVLSNMCAVTADLPSVLTAMEELQVLLAWVTEVATPHNPLTAPPVIECNTLPLLFKHVLGRRKETRKI